jgi:type 1 fimbria pilin
MKNRGESIKLSERRLARLPRIFALGACALFLSMNEASTAQGNINFWGNITNNNACVITLVQSGALGVSTDGRQLSSKVAGGQPGIADIASMRNYDISVDGPSFFMEAPSGGNDAVTFTTTYSGASINRGRDFPEQPGSTLVKLRGATSTTRVNIHLVANKPTTFPTGNYRAITTVRCE